jgi:hypothetical protein
MATHNTEKERSQTPSSVWQGRHCSHQLHWCEHENSTVQSGLHASSFRRQKPTPSQRLQLQDLSGWPPISRSLSLKCLVYCQYQGEIGEIEGHWEGWQHKGVRPQQGGSVITKTNTNYQSHPSEKLRSWAYCAIEQLWEEKITQDSGMELNSKSDDRNIYMGEVSHSLIPSLCNKVKTNEDLQHPKEYGIWHGIQRKYGIWHDIYQSYDHLSKVQHLVSMCTKIGFS